MLAFSSLTAQGGGGTADGWAGSAQGALQLGYSHVGQVARLAEAASTHSARQQHTCSLDLRWQLLREGVKGKQALAL